MQCNGSNSAIIFFSVTHLLQHSHFKEFSCHETFKEIINYLEKVNRNLPKMRLSCQKQQRLMSWRGQVVRAEQLSSALPHLAVMQSLMFSVLFQNLWEREAGGDTDTEECTERGRRLDTFWRIDLLVTESICCSSVMLQGGRGQAVTTRRLISG